MKKMNTFKIIKGEEKQDLLLEGMNSKLESIILRHLHLLYDI